MYAVFVERGEMLEKIGRRVQLLPTAQTHARQYRGSGTVTIWRVNGDGKRTERLQERRKGEMVTAPQPRI